MRLRICCGCVIDENGRIGIMPKQKGTAIELQTGPPLREQPKKRLDDSIPLEIIKNKKPSFPWSKEKAKRKKSSFTTYINEFTTPSNRSAGHINTALSSSIETFRNLTPKSGSQNKAICDSTKYKLTTLPIANTSPTVSATSNFVYVSKNGKQNQMTFEQIAPGHYQGVFKNCEFTIVNGKLLAKDGAYSDLEKDLILKNYHQSVLAMQQGVLGLEEQILKRQDQNIQNENIDYRKLSELTLPSGSKIKVNFTAENGEKSKMTFKQIKPGLFRGTFNKREFSIANGQVLALRGSDSGLNKELILSTFYRALMGMEQTKLGFQRGEWAMETRLSGDQLNPMELLKAACPEMRFLFEKESLRVHNEFRKIHGVPPLKNNELLCELAREWAEHLALKDTTYKRPIDEYGENIYHSHGLPLDAREIVSSWYNEINCYDFNNPKFTNETEHFTQMVWKDTKEMGTGIAQLGDRIWVCCYYHPPGNCLSKSFNEFVLKPRKVI